MMTGQLKALRDLRAGLSTVDGVVNVVWPEV